MMGDESKSFGRTFLDGLLGPANTARSASVHIDQSRRVAARDITSSTVNLGDLKDSVVKSIAQLPTQSNDTAEQLKPLLEQLTELLSRAPEQGVDQQVAADALEEVKTLADAARKPDEGVFLPTVRKTLRTLRGFAAELKSVPAVAGQFAGYVEQIGKLITG